MHSRTAKHTAKEVNGSPEKLSADSWPTVSFQYLAWDKAPYYVVGEGRKAKKRGETAKKLAPDELLGLKRNKPLNMMYLGWLFTFVEGETGQS